MPKRNRKEVSFTVTKAERAKIVKIARRAVALAEEHGLAYDQQWAEMDITACHANGMRLDLDKLLKADDFNLAHDVFGIRRHLDKQTGQIQNCFVPRCHSQRIVDRLGA